eukprot:EG_transcript_25129
MMRGSAYMPMDDRAFASPQRTRRVYVAALLLVVAVAVLALLHSSSPPVVEPPPMRPVKSTRARQQTAPAARGYDAAPDDAEEPEALAARPAVTVYGQPTKRVAPLQDVGADGTFQVPTAHEVATLSPPSAWAAALEWGGILLAFGLAGFGFAVWRTVKQRRRARFKQWYID